MQVKNLSPSILSSNPFVLLHQRPTPTSDYCSSPLPPYPPPSPPSTTVNPPIIPTVIHHSSPSFTTTVAAGDHHYYRRRHSSNDQTCSIERFLIFLLSVQGNPGLKTGNNEGLRS
uniref:Uncharacterized protein n=1 Tax=Helianthus annuus TaxID=4232 RepID=A0A251UH73_HELAN